MSLVTDITEIAQDIRNTYLVSEDDTIKSQCLNVSRDIKKELLKRGFKNAKLVRGVFEIDFPNEENYLHWDEEDFNSEEELQKAKYTPLHYWVELDELIIDATADQFNDEIDETMDEIIIDKINNCWRHIKHSIWE